MLEDIGEDLHLKRVQSLAAGVAGVLSATVASVAALGRAYTSLQRIETKSGIKQIDRLLSNDGIELDQVLELWVKYVVGQTPRIAIAVDWTDFDDDDQTTLCVSLMTTHGRATPLAWETVRKSTLEEPPHGLRDRDGGAASKVDFETTAVTWLGDRASAIESCTKYWLGASSTTSFASARIF